MQDLGFRRKAVLLAGLFERSPSISKSGARFSVAEVAQPLPIVFAGVKPARLAALDFGGAAWSALFFGLVLNVVGAHLARRIFVDELPLRFAGFCNLRLPRRIFLIQKISYTLRLFF
jgi:hypothetical protein